MLKTFDELTIADDYIFCILMQDDEICLTVLNLVLKNEVSKLVRIVHQDTIDGKSNAKSIRLDIMAEDDTGKLYDIEMQTTNQHNLEKRMRYYQCAIDQSSLEKGKDYELLPDSFIIFFCNFDYLKEGLPIYTIKPVCEETGKVFTDGTTKIIVNTKAADKANAGLQSFLKYLGGKEATNAFTRNLEDKVKEIKTNEKLRSEYMNIYAFEMDARRTGLKEGRAEGRNEGIAIGLAEGEARGRAEGAYQTKLETAKKLKLKGFTSEDIADLTGLSVEEIEKL